MEEIIENLAGNALWSCNFCIRRKSFEDLGAFDEDFKEASGEDIEFAARLRAAGLKIRFLPDAIVYHPARRLSLTQWVTRVFQSRWHVLYRMKVCGLCHAGLREVDYLARVTIRTLLRRDPSPRPNQLFRLVLNWLLLPIWVPYLIYWESRFRKQCLK
ncbi:MAG: hypothetical protein JO076_01755 [Verrucomicrobia bacterium]|nr:hypothetical protein [Verrucomicrobiota bacterium]